MNNGTIDLQRNGFIATLVINRPAKLNALTPEMLEQLLAHCHTLETDSEIRVVLLTSASEKAFCVGADIHRWDLSFCTRYVAQLDPPRSSGI